MDSCIFYGLGRKKGQQNGLHSLRSRELQVAAAAGTEVPLGKGAGFNTVARPRQLRTILSTNQIRTQPPTISLILAGLSEGWGMELGRGEGKYQKVPHFLPPLLQVAT